MGGYYFPAPPASRTPRQNILQRAKITGFVESTLDGPARLPQQKPRIFHIMREGIHPDYREVCFVDLSNGFKFVTRSCVNTKETVKMDDGRELPLFKLDTSSESHPFYTGTQKSVDSMGGRVEKFRNRYAKVAR
jgi:large subunit ribosomal protein L31